MKLTDRIKSKLASINLVSVAFFGMSIFSIAFAWFAYTNVVKTNFEVDVKIWKIKITNNNNEITNNYTFNVNDLYPGMDDFSDSFLIENQGELPAKIDYKIKKLRVFDTTVNTDNMTFYELQRDYPFKIDFSYNKRYLAPNDTATFNVSCTWPLESGNDDLDTQYGNMAYDFYQSENALHQSDPNYQIRSGLELEVEIIVVQYIDETDSFANDSWDTIQINVERGNTSAYQVGDTKTVSINGIDYTVRLVNKSDDYGICHRNDTSLTACGFVVDFATAIENEPINSTSSTDGGWPATDLYQLFRETIFSSLPYELKKHIATTRVISGHNINEINNYITWDKLYLLSYSELTDEEDNPLLLHDTVRNYTRKLDYYQSNNELVKKNIQNRVVAWWTRSVMDTYDNGYIFISTGGYGLLVTSVEIYGSMARYTPAFRIE